MHKHNREKGMASILTVVFFTLIISIITIGFLRITVQENSEALSDDLSKAAYAAAYSGVNDAKRAIIYCAKSPSAAGCTQLNTGTCPGFVGDVNLRNALSINPDAQNSVIVGDPTLNQRYTCTTITTDTQDVAGSLELNQASNSVFVPLNGTAPYTSVRISWHKVTASVNPPNTAIVGNPRDVNAAGSAGGTKWSGVWPALLRASIMQHPATGINIDGISAAGATNITEDAFFLYPNGAAGATTAILSPLASQPTSQDIKCLEDDADPDTIPNGYTVGDALYNCRVTIPVSSLAGPAYLHLTSMYKGTDYAVELLDGSNVVTFDDVSPLIDSTGAAGNVFRRVKVRVAFGGSGSGGRNPILPNAIDVGGSVCKNFRVNVDPAQFTENCADFFP